MKAKRSYKRLRADSYMDTRGPLPCVVKAALNRFYASWGYRVKVKTIKCVLKIQ